MTVTWGVIGAGGIARRRMIPEVTIHARKSRIGAVTDLDRQAAEEVRTEFDLPRAYRTAEELLADPEVHAVYIATPVFRHLEQVKAAAQAGKHVLCEKALGLNTQEAEEMLAACQQAGVLFGIAYMMRFHACHQAAKRLLAEERIGCPVLARAQLSCWYPAIEGAWRQDPELGGGGAFINLGSHCLDLLEYLLDARVTEVMARQDTLVQDYPVEDASVVVARFDNGALGVVDNYFCIPDEASQNRLEIYGSAGSLLAQDTIGQTSEGSLQLYSARQESYAAQQQREQALQETITPEPVPIYAAEIDHMSDCIVKGITPMISGEEGVWSQRVIEACYESARRGQTVPL